ncbi:MAG: winged helix-turn-helix transcriptional regulator [Acidimicrobiia bacterium]
MTHKPHPTRTSPLAEAAARVGDRWTLLVVEALLEQPRRFNDLLDEVSGIAPNTLSQRLKHLAEEGIVVARPYSRRPPRSIYSLTAVGSELAGALRSLAHWGARQSDEAESLIHQWCGTAVEARWWCPTCAVPAGDEETSELRYV